MSSLLEVQDLVVQYRSRGGRTVHAVSGVSFSIGDGETLGLVGESGCGKSSTGRAILQMPRPTSGTVHFEGRDLTGLSRSELRRTRRRLQMIFQDPASSLNPRRRVRDLLGEPFNIWGGELAGPSEQDGRIEEVMAAVGLDGAAVGDRRRHELSGGQCQRVNLARALLVEPRLIICDEPVSALDVSVQAQILNLLEDTKARFGLSLLFIAHDLAVVKNVSDRIAVMYLGRIVEMAPAEELYRRPAHPYTAALLAAVPDVDAALGPAPAGRPLQGELPSPTDPPAGCRFRTRCPRAEAVCATEPPAVTIGPGHWSACHFALEVAGPPPAAPG